MSRILVTGAPGWLGNILLSRLVGTAAAVRLLVNPALEKTNRDLTLPDQVKSDAELMQGDLRDPQRLGEAVRGVTLVYHVAAVQHTTRVSEMYAVNAEGTALLAQAAADAGVEKFVFVSSSS